MMSLLSRLLVFSAIVFRFGGVVSFQPIASNNQVRSSSKIVRSPASLNVLQEPKAEKAATDVDEATEKYGLEVGLYESLKKDDGGETAKSLLKKYGVAYLATSIPLAIVSFAICYALVNAGVDVSALLGKVGIESTSTTDTAGTFAIAYAAHKAASPIRFPPTVLLTPVVAKMIGKEPEATVEE